MRVFYTAEITGKSDCDENIIQLEWSYDPICAYDVEKYRIFFTPNPQKYRYVKIDSVYRDINLDHYKYSYSHNGVNVGCYYVTAVDSATLESKESNIVCLDECKQVGDGGYELPNVFTPNNDGMNDVFIAHNPGEIVTKVNMQIFNRDGKLVFKTEDPYINWDGRDIDSKRFVSTGVYYYFCDVYENRLEGLRIVPIAGFIHVYRENVNNTSN